jgi:cytochrome c553
MNTLLSKLLALVALAAASLAAQAQDAAAGRRQAATCIGCHGIPGYQASFPEVHKVPKISGQNAKYIAAALEAYRKGERKHPTMRNVAASLSDKDIANLAAFYAGHTKGEAAAVPDKPATEPSTQVAELLKKGNCASCHGENMNKPIDPAYPKLAGQHADYLGVALKSYQAKGHAVGRGNPIMGGMVQAFTPAELKVLGQYIASLPGELQTVPESRFR